MHGDVLRLVRGVPKIVVGGSLRKGHGKDAAGPIYPILIRSNRDFGYQRASGSAGGSRGGRGGDGKPDAGPNFGYQGQQTGKAERFLFGGPKVLVDLRGSGAGLGGIEIGVDLLLSGQSVVRAERRLADDIGFGKGIR